MYIIVNVQKYSVIFAAGISGNYIQSNQHGRDSLWWSITAMTTLIARFMGPTWGPSGAIRTQVGPMLAPWTLLSGKVEYTWRHHQMKTFSSLLSLCEGNHRSLVDSPHQGQWYGTLMISLICTWSNGWVNNRDARDSRQHHTHCDVTVTQVRLFISQNTAHLSPLWVNYGVFLENISFILRLFCIISILFLLEIWL